MAHPHPMPSPRPSGSGASAISKASESGDRVVHATWKDIQASTTWELARYDRQGRWYLEIIPQNPSSKVVRDRQKTVHDAAEMALRIEAMGGTIHEGRSGGGRFDYMVQSGRAKKARAAR